MGITVELQRINVPTQVGRLDDTSTALNKLNEGMRLLQDQLNRIVDVLNGHEQVINGTEEADNT